MVGGCRVEDGWPEDGRRNKGFYDLINFNRREQGIDTLGYQARRPCDGCAASTLSTRLAQVGATGGGGSVLFFARASGATHCRRRSPLPSLIFLPSDSTIPTPPIVELLRPAPVPGPLAVRPLPLVGGGRTPQPASTVCLPYHPSPSSKFGEHHNPRQPPPLT